MKIVSLKPGKPQHTRIVLSMVVQSKLDYGDMDEDARLLAWHTRQGRWAVAVHKNGDIAGIACVVRLSDTGEDALLWLEVLPPYQRQGMGEALLDWAHTQARHRLSIHSVPSAEGFYQRAGVRT